MILTTGAARRVGAAIAVALHDAGARVVLHARHSLAAAEALGLQVAAQLRAGGAH